MVVKRTSRKAGIGLPMVLFLGVIALVGACNPSETAPQCPEVQECPDVVVVTPVPFEELWASSGHADTQSEAFNHWNDANPPEIPEQCAKCHSRPGFIDFLGIDGSKPGQVDHPAETGTTITCYVCHNELSLDLDSATFPSGARIRDLGRVTVCVQCHMGTASTVSVDKAIADADLASDDTPSDQLVFINSHSISAATPFGTEVQGAYEYPGQTYAGRFVRGDEFFGCDQCHDSHSLAVQFDTCGQCHTIMGSEPQDIRVKTNDFDGDGDIQEGIAYEIEHLNQVLLTAIQYYAQEIIGIPIAYTLDVYPYFFVDINGNGEVDPEEAVASNRYASWSPRLLRAAYNYNYVLHDPGAFAHNSTYSLQVLYDSLQDIGGDVSGLVRP